MRDVALAVLNGADEPELRRLASELARHIEGEVRFGRHDRMLYSTDASIYQVQPLGVVVPRHLDDVRATVSFCAERGLPILPRGGGTSLAGQAVSRAVVIDFSAWCNRILEIDPSSGIARVEPGVVLDQLNAALAPHHLMFGPDVATSSHANIGGMIGNNSAGAHSVRYGRTVEHLDALRVLTAQGEEMELSEGAASSNPTTLSLTHAIASVLRSVERDIDERFPKLLRHVDGYNLDLILRQLRSSTPGTFDRVNLAHLVCGSEGTLAVTLEATLRLVDAPRSKTLAIVGYANVDDALIAVAPILQTQPAAVELVDEVVMAAAAGNTECRRYLDEMPRLGGRLPGAVLYVEYFADDESQCREQFARLREIASSAAIRELTSPSAMRCAWQLRKSGEPLLHGLPGDRKPITFVEDLAVDPAKLPDFVREFREIVRRHGTDAAYYAHASVGCLHIRPRINLRSAHDRGMMQSIVAESAALVRRYGGALSGEHGDGRLRSHLLEAYFGTPITDAFARIKHLFDPQHRLNPGVIVAPAPMTAALRVQPRQRIVELPRVRTFFRFEREHGFGHAVEQCNGAGVCRRMTGGTMCPSYRATRDERHATRGRGNALRLAVTGQFACDGASPTWNDGETLRTLDLCLSCKACKSECPSNVDVARMKAEYLAQGFAARGRVPLRTRIFGNVRALNAIGSRFAPIANSITRNALVRTMVESAMGVDRRRSLPRFEPSLRKWFDRTQTQRRTTGPAVILFPDCFTMFNEPHIGRCAVSALDALGYRVILPTAGGGGGGCCGRAMISMGMLEQAVSSCSETAVALEHAIFEHGATSIVCCEPSCVSAIVDDWQDLDLRCARATVRRLGAMTTSVEDFIERRWAVHPIPPRPRSTTDDEPPVVLHGHCHQKALWGTGATESLLRRILGDRVRVLDSGCCGMAGSFGYSTAHYDISMTIAEQSIFSKLQRDGAHETIIAPGTSCRHQIRDGIGAEALHPIELTAQRLITHP